MSESELRHVRQICETLPGRVVGQVFNMPVEFSRSGQVENRPHELPLIAELLKLLRREAAGRQRAGGERIEDARRT